MKRLLLTSLLAAALAPAPGVLRASGTYARPSAEQSSPVDAAKYAEGKKIFMGKARLGEGMGAGDPAQAERLQKLQSLLPAGAQKRGDLARFAGRLTGDQLEALEYYLSVRYKISAE